jgi:hypothetical protein
MLTYETCPITAAPTYRIRSDDPNRWRTACRRLPQAIAVAQHHNDVAKSPEGEAPGAPSSRLAREGLNDLSMVAIMSARSCCLSRLALP